MGAAAGSLAAALARSPPRLDPDVATAARPGHRPVGPAEAGYQARHPGGHRPGDAAGGATQQQPRHSDRCLPHRSAALPGVGRWRGSQLLGLSPRHPGGGFRRFDPGRQPGLSAGLPGRCRPDAGDASLHPGGATANALGPRTGQLPPGCAGPTARISRPHRPAPGCSAAGPGAALSATGWTVGADGRSVPGRRRAGGGPDRPD